MGLITLIVVVALIGLFCWVITTLIPMDAKFKQIIYVIAVVGIVLYLLSAFGLLSGFHDIKIGK